jgi:glutamate-1-semialdehyde 2,1-aminomutase
MHGITPEDRANLLYYTYNDIDSVERALARCPSDLAGIIVSPFRHDAGFDQELVKPEFAHHLRSACTRLGGALILDDVRCGFRLNFGSSWEPLGIRPDLSAWSKALGNGYPIAALLGADGLREAAAGVFATGSFWFSAVPMAASLATLAVLERETGVAHMHRIGERLCRGLREQAASAGLPANVTGHPTMPYLSFAGETDRQWTAMFAAECARRGLYVHPRHNWFVSTAIDDKLLAEVLAITEQAFAAVRAAWH